MLAFPHYRTDAARQNALSKEFFGERSQHAQHQQQQQQQLWASGAAGVTDASLPLLCDVEPALPPLESGLAPLLLQLFAYEPEKLQAMLDRLAEGPGRVWRGAVAACIGRGVAGFGDAYCGVVATAWEEPYNSLPLADGTGNNFVQQAHSELADTVPVQACFVYQAAWLPPRRRSSCCCRNTVTWPAACRS